MLYIVEGELLPHAQKQGKMKRGFLMCNVHIINAFSEP